MRDHPSIQMVSEKVIMTIGPKRMDVDCRFEFFNHGKATTVDVGFPDKGDVQEEDGKEFKRSGSFASFRTWVEGKPYKTHIVEAEGDYWHVKRVTFRGHRRAHVRVRYSQYLGLEGLGWWLRPPPDEYDLRAWDGYCDLAAYAVSTGGSWYGKLLRADFIVDFSRMPLGSLKGFRQNIGAHLQAVVCPRDPRKGLPRGFVVYSGLNKARVAGRKLIFRLKNWKPTEADDLWLRFHFRREQS